MSSCFSAGAHFFAWLNIHYLNHQTFNLTPRQPMPAYPKRIVCLTEETTEWLYLLGEQDRIVGISAYTERPTRAKLEKPVVSAYIGGHIGKIKALKPDLVIGFSDVQAELARELISENLQVLVTNQRSVADIFDTLDMMGRLVDAKAKSDQLLQQFRDQIEQTQEKAASLAKRPKVYFEEWDEPMISAIEWVSDLIGIVGGENIFSDRAAGKASKDRYVTHEEVITGNPDLFIGCWCGKALDRDSIKARAGYAEISAIQSDRVYEMDPAIILQPGPACLTDGLQELARIISTLGN